MVQNIISSKYPYIYIYIKLNSMILKKCGVGSR